MCPCRNRSIRKTWISRPCRPPTWRRVIPERLTDDDLLRLYERAVVCHGRKAILRLGEELLRRESVADKVDRAELICGDRGTDCRIPTRRSVTCGRRRRIAVAKKQSPAKYLLSELPLRLIRGEAAESKEIIQQLQTRHLREPGVSEALYNILVQFGIVTPEGQPGAVPETAEVDEPTPSAVEAVDTGCSASGGGREETIPALGSGLDGRSCMCTDDKHMSRAIELAARGEGLVEPNPMVGCVIVKDGVRIGEGWHRQFGGPHAEVEALRACDADVAGATMYVTLEPCCHTGKTPPCTEALLRARIGRVVVAQSGPISRRGRPGHCSSCAAPAYRSMSECWSRQRTS